MTLSQRKVMTYIFSRKSDISRFLSMLVKRKKLVIVGGEPAYLPRDLLSSNVVIVTIHDTFSALRWIEEVKNKGLPMPTDAVVILADSLYYTILAELNSRRLATRIISKLVRILSFLSELDGYDIYVLTLSKQGCGYENT